MVQSSNIFVLNANAIAPTPVPAPAPTLINMFEIESERCPILFDSPK